MANEKVISFDLKGDFGFFKKPDYNDGMQLSYNMIHKPAILGILGAIIGLEGYKRKGELPQYYVLLKDLGVGIQPLQHERGNFQKTTVKYTNGIGYANADGNLLIEESMLIKPAYRCYLLLNISNNEQDKLYNYIIKGQCEYIPYLGKNEFQAWFENVQEWEAQPFKQNDIFTIDSLFVKEGTIRNKRSKVKLASAMGGSKFTGTFIYFEKIPTGFNEALMQYELSDIAYSDWQWIPESEISSLYTLNADERIKIVQFL